MEAAYALISVDLFWKCQYVHFAIFQHYSCVATIIHNPTDECTNEAVDCVVGSYVAAALFYHRINCTEFQRCHQHPRNNVMHLWNNKFNTQFVCVHGHHAASAADWAAAVREYILCIVFQLVRLEIDRLEFVSARTALIRVRKKCVEKHKCMTLALTFALKLLRCPSLLCTLCIYEIVCIFFPFLNVTLILFCFCIVFILSVGRFYLFNVL